MSDFLAFTCLSGPVTRPESKLIFIKISEICSFYAGPEYLVEPEKTSKPTISLVMNNSIIYNAYSVIDLKSRNEVGLGLVAAKLLIDEGTTVDDLYLKIEAAAKESVKATLPVNKKNMNNVPQADQPEEERKSRRKSKPKESE